MSKKFWAENRAKGTRWEPAEGKKQYLVMYDSGYLAVVTEDFYQYVTPLDVKEWRVVKAEPDDLEPVAWYDPAHGLPYGWTELPPVEGAVYLYSAEQLALVQQKNNELIRHLKEK